MFNSIYKMLESFGFGSQKRALHIHFSNLALNTQVFIQRIEVGERETKYSRNSSQSVRIIYRDIGTVDSAMQPDEQQPKILPPLSEVIPLPA